MKRVAFLTSFLVLFWLSSGLAAAQVLSGSGPLDEVSKTVDPVKDTVNKTVDPVKDTVNKTVDPVKDTVSKTVDKVAEPVKKVTNQVTKTVDKAAKDVNSSAKDPAGSVPSVNDKPKSVPTDGGAAGPRTSRSKAGNSDTNKVAFSSNKARKTTGATRAEAIRDTEKVAAVGKTIEPAQVKGAQIIAPATGKESEGSGLSRTGAQILTWLSLACWLVGIGAAFVWRGRTRVRVATS